MPGPTTKSKPYLCPSSPMSYIRSSMWMSRTIFKKHCKKPVMQHLAALSKVRTQYSHKSNNDICHTPTPQNGLAHQLRNHSTSFLTCSSKIPTLDAMGKSGLGLVRVGKGGVCHHLVLTVWRWVEMGLAFGVEWGFGEGIDG